MAASPQLGFGFPLNLQDIYKLWNSDEEFGFILTAVIHSELEPNATSTCSCSLRASSSIITKATCRTQKSHVIDWFFSTFSLYHCCINLILHKRDGLSCIPTLVPLFGLSFPLSLSSAECANVSSQLLSNVQVLCNTLEHRLRDHGSCDWSVTFKSK